MRFHFVIMELDGTQITARDIDREWLHDDKETRKLLRFYRRIEYDELPGGELEPTNLPCTVPGYPEMSVDGRFSRSEACVTFTFKERPVARCWLLGACEAIHYTRAVEFMIQDMEMRDDDEDDPGSLGRALREIVDRPVAILFPIYDPELCMPYHLETLIACLAIPFFENAARFVDRREQAMRNFFGAGNLAAPNN